MSTQTITITDNRTGKAYELPIEHNTIRANDLRRIKTAPDDFGLTTYDPGFMATCACQSHITFIDGDLGILEYRGYPIEQIAENGSHLETSYLLWNGELPTKDQLTSFVRTISENTVLDDTVRALVTAFRQDAHPMGILMAATAGLSTLHPEARKIGDPELRLAAFHRAVANVPVIAAAAYRHNRGLPVVAPEPGLSYTANFLHMMFKPLQGDYQVDPVLERALDVLFILHADHEQNCSTSTMRVVGSAQSDPYASMAAAIAALWGPLHGGANEAVLKMLRQIGSKDHIPEFIQKVKAGEGRLMGFGHRVYKNYDPRAKIIKQTADQVFSVTGRNPLIDIAVELERIALQDDYFVSRKLYPNVDFYSGIIYEAMQIPSEMFTVLFAIGRTPGWLSHWNELVQDHDQKIARPRQIFLGPARRDYIAMGNR